MLFVNDLMDVNAETMMKHNTIIQKPDYFMNVVKELDRQK